mmetsp:Transcript_2633/g.7867  ORF Transcript_2633/g.7867 Transcript_2633/m.7867 type:complete len:315 (+) Transcript_2633:70-1014(+)
MDLISEAACCQFKQNTENPSLHTKATCTLRKRAPLHAGSWHAVGPRVPGRGGRGREGFGYRTRTDFTYCEQSSAPCLVRRRPCVLSLLAPKTCLFPCAPEEARASQQPTTPRSGWSTCEAKDDSQPWSEVLCSEIVTARLTKAQAVCAAIMLETLAKMASQTVVITTGTAPITAVDATSFAPLDRTLNLATDDKTWSSVGTWTKATTAHPNAYHAVRPPAWCALTTTSIEKAQSTPPKVLIASLKSRDSVPSWRSIVLLTKRNRLSQTEIMPYKSLSKEVTWRRSASCEHWAPLTERLSSCSARILRSRMRTLS